MSPNRRTEFISGARDTFPLIIGAIPFGLIYGAVAVANGIDPIVIMGLSLFVFAGSAQFIAVGLISQGAAFSIIVLTTFIVNLRHALYSASLAPYVSHLSQRWLLPLSFWLTDETYAVVISHYQREDKSPYKHWYYFGSAVSMYINWQLVTVVGIVAGQRLQNFAQLGLDFAMVVTFIGITMPLIKNRPMLICALSAGIVAVLTNGIPNKLGLIIAALAGILAGFTAETMNQQSAVLQEK
ncbi:MAG: AzlC family ABC transporter permease [Anaerolineae bacterium]|nr:AzlC family ABC transporter permease [Anaerolineae bacterium]